MLNFRLEILSGRWMYPIISEKANFDWAVINFPYGEGKQYLDTSGWAISKNSKHYLFLNTSRTPLTNITTPRMTKRSVIGRNIK